MQWAGGRSSRAKYEMPESHKWEGAVAGSTKRLASRYYQLKAGYCRIGHYFHWAKVRPTAQCWWCRCRSQTRDHLFKVCSEWKMQQKILWAEVQKETGRWKSRWKIQDLLADGRCSQAVLDFLTATDVGRRVLSEEHARSEGSKWELRSAESGERKGRRSQGSWAPRRRPGRSHAGPPPQGVPRVEGPAEDRVGRRAEESGRGKNRLKIRDLLADGRCS